MIKKYRNWDENIMLHRLEDVQFRLEELEIKINVDKLTEDEIKEYNNLIEEHRELVDKLGFATMRYQK